MKHSKGGGVMVYEILRIGKENAIKSDELCKKLDVTKGYMQKAIRREETV